MILNFTADRTEAAPGEDIVLTWTTSGGDRAEITFYDDSFNSLEVPLNGQLIVKVAYGGVRVQVSYALTVQNSTGDISASVFVRPPCAHTYFFFFPVSWRGTWRDLCPASPPLYTPAAEQVFEYGRMIWLQTGGVIAGPDIYVSGPHLYVLLNNGSAYGFPDEWAPGQPEGDPNIIPPAGYYQPVRGFGKLWREKAWVRESLGWALAPEQIFDGVYQASQWHVYVMDAYLRSADGFLIYMTSGASSNAFYWQFASP